MPETYQDEIYQYRPEGNTLASRTPRAVSDAEIKRRDAPARLRQAYSALQGWADDARQASAAEQTASDGWAAATAGQKDAANKALHTRMAVTFDRLATFFERFGDVLLKDGLDQ